MVPSAELLQRKRSPDVAFGDVDDAMHQVKRPDMEPDYPHQNQEEIYSSELNLRKQDPPLSELPAFPPTVLYLNLRVLDVTNNALTSLDGVHQLPSLRVLSAGMNQLSDLPPSILFLPMLETLVLSYNQFTVYPKVGCEIATLKTLILNHNPITSIPDDIGSLQRLETLSVVRGRLTALPATLNQLKSLVSLNIQENFISELPSLQGLTKLVELKAQNNRLRYIHPSIGSCTRLNRLLLDYNRLQYVPKEVTTLPNLTALWVHFNPLAIPGNDEKDSNNYIQERPIRSLRETASVTIEKSGLKLKHPELSKMSPAMPYLANGVWTLCDLCSRFSVYANAPTYFIDMVTADDMCKTEFPVIKMACCLPCIQKHRPEGVKLVTLRNENDDDIRDVTNHHSRFNLYPGITTSTTTAAIDLSALNLEIRPNHNTMAPPAPTVEHEMVRSRSLPAEHLVYDYDDLSDDHGTSDITDSDESSQHDNDDHAFSIHLFSPFTRSLARRERRMPLNSPPPRRMRLHIHENDDTMPVAPAATNNNGQSPIQCYVEVVDYGLDCVVLTDGGWLLKAMPLTRNVLRAMSSSVSGDESLMDDIDG